MNSTKFKLQLYLHTDYGGFSRLPGVSLPLPVENAQHQGSIRLLELPRQNATGWEALTREISFFTVLKAASPRSRRQQVWCLWRPLSLTCRRLPSLWVSPPGLSSVQAPPWVPSSSPQGTRHSEVTLVTSALAPNVIVFSGRRS